MFNSVNYFPLELPPVKECKMGNGLQFFLAKTGMCDSPVLPHRYLPCGNVSADC